MTSFGEKQLFELTARLTRERERAHGIIATILATYEWEKEIPQEWRNAGVVQELLEAAKNELESSPKRSLSIAQYALTIVSSIPSETYPATVMASLAGSTWKEIATAHRYVSEYDQALHALDRADAHFGSSAALGHDVAVIALCRAIVFAEMRRDDDAIRLLRQTTPVLRSYGDQRRLAQATLLQAMIHHRRGDFERAQQIYESLATKTTDDLHTLAAVYNNLGVVRMRLGNHQGAVLALQQARALFAELGMPAEVTRNDWTLAQVMMQSGEFESAVPIITSSRSDFLKRGMAEEAGMAALDLIECHLAMNDPASARALAELVTAEFTHARLNQRALTALAYLRAALPAPNARPAVRHVRSYLEQLKTEPERAFLPLP